MCSAARWRAGSVSALTPLARRLLDQWPPRKEGLLSKRGAIHRSYKTRTFVLDRSTLSYHRAIKVDGVLPPPQGTVDLSSPGTRVEAAAAECDLDVVTRRRTFHLRATDAGDRDEWVEALRVSIQIATAV